VVPHIRITANVSRITANVSRINLLRSRLRVVFETDADVTAPNVAWTASGGRHATAERPAIRAVGHALLVDLSWLSRGGAVWCSQAR
jgi:hypothetical protein